MDTICLRIDNIKSIKEANIELPFENGVYSLVGTNGCGKSTILQLTAQLINDYALKSLQNYDYCEGSSFCFKSDEIENKWIFENGNWQLQTKGDRLKYNGMYEGSLFYGTRFRDSREIDRLLEKGYLTMRDIVPADDYIIEKLSSIIHGDTLHYRALKRVRNKYLKEQMRLKNTPYFEDVNGHLISQYRMSSGECMLISLLHFIYNSIVRRSLPSDQKILVLIDEIELALHPVAVSRLLQLLTELASEHKNLIVILTSHSPEVIRKIKPENLYRIENINGKLSVESKCYPSFLIRDVYLHDGFDYVVLVEDDLAKCFVEKILFESDMRRRKLVHVVPVGGWENVLKLHLNLLHGNVLGLGTKIVSVLDGDIQQEALNIAEYSTLPKLFLPISSIEKFIFKNIIEQRDDKFYNILNDKYFTVKALSTLISEHFEKYPQKVSEPDKKFYFRLKKDMEGRNIEEKYFITNLCNDIFSFVNVEPFRNSLAKILS